ncbi:MAG: histidine kinase [Actinomycetaceae bacterium]|nr:histidine kinase [Arcanobacterium sp.]MDD7504497.1 histidine kinase [Actinomycetaceae bacterium]MDY6142833.1 histidine kinase [Arcanobacterium sp.]
MFNLVASAFLFVFDTMFLLLDRRTIDPSEVALTLLLFGLFVAAGAIHLLEYVFIAALELLNVLDLIHDYSSIYFALCILMTYWVMRSWIMPALAVILFNGLASATLSASPALHIFSSVLAAAIILGTGMALRWHNARRVTADEARKRSEEATARIREELARKLHDSTAKDLAHVFVLAQDISSRHPDLAEEMRPLFHAASQASNKIRTMIISSDAMTGPIALQEVIDDVKRMLMTRRITLDTVYPHKVDDTLNDDQRRIAALVLRECASNIFKYAPSESHADLVIDADTHTGLLTISLSNEVAARPDRSAISTGYGLTNLHNMIREVQGTIECVDLRQRWITYITIPH